MSTPTARKRGKSSSTGTAAGSKHEHAAQNGKASLSRTAFRTSRSLDFFSVKELTAQIGHAQHEWPLVIVKELLDNAIDSCEEASIAPRISLTVDSAGIQVTDNGPGIPPEVVAGITDFSVRVSSREAYVSPCRGAQGNALKTVIAMPSVLGAAGPSGAVRIEARGVRHVIEVGVDRIRQEPLITHGRENIAKSKGTTFFVPWGASPDGQSPRSILDDAKSRFLQIAEDFIWLNPHLSLVANWRGEEKTYRASNRNWAKWKPSDPTDPHWYGADEFSRLIAAYIAHDAESGRGRTVRELVSEFRGLSGTAKGKRVAEVAGLARARLSELAGGNEIDRGAVTKLLNAMKAESRPVKPVALGMIGSDHIAEQCRLAGAEMKTYRYHKMAGITKGLPWLIETAFAWCPSAKSRRIITGVNWSPGIINPFRQLGKYGTSLDSVLEAQRAGANEPTVLMLHIACPRVRYADRGKSSVIVEG